MSYTVWTAKRYAADEGMPNVFDQGDTCLLADIPTAALADKLCDRLAEIYGDDSAWVEQD